MDAFVYLRVAPGKIEDVVIALRGRHGIRHAVAVVGPWDVMVAVEAADFGSIARTVLRHIQATEGVQHTYTAPVLPLSSLGIYAGGPGMPPMPMHRPGHACYVHIRAAAEAGSVAGIVQALGGELREGRGAVDQHHGGRVERAGVRGLLRAWMTVRRVPHPLHHLR